MADPAELESIPGRELIQDDLDAFNERLAELGKTRRALNDWIGSEGAQATVEDMAGVLDMAVSRGQGLGSDPSFGGNPRGMLSASFELPSDLKDQIIHLEGLLRYGLACGVWLSQTRVWCEQVNLRSGATGFISDTTRPKANLIGVAADGTIVPVGQLQEGDHESGPVIVTPDDERYDFFDDDLNPQFTLAFA